MMWDHWIKQNWSSFSRGEKVHVPESMPKPWHSGFTQPPLADPVGQSRDWVLPLNDESRLHVHEYEDGVLVAHRDEIDPDQGPIEAASHFFKESLFGKIILYAGLTFVICMIVCGGKK